MHLHPFVSVRHIASLGRLTVFDGETGNLVTTITLPGIQNMWQAPRRTPTVRVVTTW